MGLFKNMKDMQAQAQQAQQAPGAGQSIPGMGDMAGVAAQAQLMQKLAQAGVEAPGVIHTMRPTGQTDIGGGQEHQIDVSVRPPGGEPYQTTITQSMLPAQLEGLSEGQAITVKYDPDSPTSAIIYSW